MALTGCASAAPTPEPTSTVRDGVTYRADEHLQLVWLADGFSVARYQTLLVLETRAEVPKLNPDGAENLEWARGLLRDEIVNTLRARSVFPSVVLTTGDVPSGTRSLRMETIIVEYEKGGGAARFFAGLYGAGQPVIRVRGRVTDGDRPMFAFESRRSGDSDLLTRVRRLSQRPRHPGRRHPRPRRSRRFPDSQRVGAVMSRRQSHQRRGRFDNGANAGAGGGS
jgi:hypothetical protein